MPRRSDAKERLMNAAMDLIWENSYGAISVDAICEKAGAKEGQFLLLFRIEIGIRRDGTGSRLAAQESENGRNLFGLRGAARTAVAAILSTSTQGKPGDTANAARCSVVPTAALAARSGRRTARFGEQVHTILDRNTKYFESAIRDADAQGLISAPNAKAKAQMLVAYFQGSLAQARIENDVRRLRGLAAGALELLGAGRARNAK